MRYASALYAIQDRPTDTNFGCTLMFLDDEGHGPEYMKILSLLRCVEHFPQGEGWKKHRTVSLPLPAADEALPAATPKESTL